MYTQIVAITQPWVRTEDNTRFLDAEEFIVFCARVSNPSNQLNLDSAPKLLKYCIKHEHWSIFEQCYMTAEIQTSRDISAQIIRHKSFSFQEFSQRYSNVAGLESFVLRKQAEKNRQSSEEMLDLPDEFVQKIKDHLIESVDLYNEVIKSGGARECARKILPLCTQTTLYMSGTVRSWIHYLSLRCKQDTQLEHREIAESIKKSFVRIFPNISDALGWKEEIAVQENKTPTISESTEENVRKNTFQPFHPDEEAKIKLEKDTFVI